MGKNGENLMSSSDKSTTSEASTDLYELQESLIYKETQRRKELEKLSVIPRKKLKNAIKRLKEVPKQKSKKLSTDERRSLLMQKACTKNKVIDEHVWFSPIYIMKIIRNCILTRNWNNLTLLLLLLLKQNKSYHGFIKQVTIFACSHLIFKFNSVFVFKLDLTRDFINTSLVSLMKFIEFRIKIDITLWNFMCNPTDGDDEFLKNLIHLCNINK